MNKKYYPYIGLGLLAVAGGGYLIYKTSQKNELDSQIDAIKNNSPGSDMPITNTVNTIENVINGIMNIFKDKKATPDQSNGNVTGQSTNQSQNDKSQIKVSEDSNFYYYADGSKLSKQNGFTYYPDGSIYDQNGLNVSLS